MTEPDLGRLHAAALASEDQTDWMAFYQVLAGSSLVVPLSSVAGQTARPVLESHEGVETVPAYLSMSDYASALTAPGDYAELAGAELAALLDGQETPLLLMTAPELLVTPGQLSWIASTFGAEVTRATGAGVSLSRPDLPALEVMEALGQTVGALGADCPEAWLVQMTEPDGEPELVLVLGLADGVRAMEPQIAETVTRAIQAVTDQPFAVACPDRGAPLMASARQNGIGIGGGDPA